jgi:hypothetical protein
LEKKLKRASNGCKTVLVLLGISRIWFCFWYLPFVEGVAIAKNNPEFSIFYWPCVIWIWCYALPRSIADIGFLRVLSAVGKGEPIGVKNAGTLSNIATVALIVTAICLIYGLVLAMLGAAQPGIFLFTLYMGVVGVGFYFGLRTLSLAVLTRS